MLRFAQVLLMALLVMEITSGIEAQSQNQATSIAQESARANVAITLPGQGLAQHPFLYCGEWQQRGKSKQIMYIMRDGKVVWTYSIPAKEEYGDCTRLSNGNIIFSRPARLEHSWPSIFHATA